ALDVVAILFDPASAPIRIVVLPTAAGRGRPDRAAAIGRAAFERRAAATSRRAIIEEARVVDAASAADPAAVERLANADLIHLPPDRGRRTGRTGCRGRGRLLVRWGDLRARGRPPRRCPAASRLSCPPSDAASVRAERPSGPGRRRLTISLRPAIDRLIGPVDCPLDRSHPRR